MVVVTCARCSAVLSRYRKPSEKVCLTCADIITTRSIEHAENPTDTTGGRDVSAYTLRWSGLEWSTIAHRLDLSTPGAANRAANRYAQRNELRLP